MTTRAGLALAAAGVGVVVFPCPAQAHVEIQPDHVEGGDSSVVAFRVPNERDNADMTKLRVILPKNHPMGSVQTTATPGWKVATATRKLDKPIEMSGAKVNSVVSEVTWAATGPGIRPGQFKDFEVSLGQLPKSGHLVFTAIQIYSSGEQVRWNEVSPDGSLEPEHPAPSLDISAPGPEDGSMAERMSAEPSAGNASVVKPAAASTTGNDSAPLLPTVLSATALLVAFGAAGLAWRRRRT